MSEPLHLSRLTLKRSDSAVAPLLDIIAPTDAGEAMAIQHKLMWTLMPGDVQAAFNRKDPEKARTCPFLWREEANRFYMLGPEPTPESPYFDVETKTFAPNLSPGDRLAFDLRVNATVDRKTGEDETSTPTRHRRDIVVDLMVRQEETGEASRHERAARRQPAADEAALAWLNQRGERDGYAIETIISSAYRTVALPRRRGKAVQIGVFDIKGLLSVRDPAAYLARLQTGFGRAKAFGCGLMLIRRAP